MKKNQQKNAFNCRIITILVFLITAVNLNAQNESSVKDIDGNEYKAIKIGKQKWMAENLKVTRFRNGDEILHADSRNLWKKAADEGIPAWCYYRDNPENGEKYGLLYNWHAVNDPRGLAPEGWKVADDKEWTQLTEYFDDDLAEKMAYSFYAQNGGLRLLHGWFKDGRNSAYWWTSSKFIFSKVWYRFFNYESGRFDRPSEYKGNGMSVRCVEKVN